MFSFFILLCLSISCHANLESHFKKIEDRIQSCPIKNIDFIYIINLDQRPEKLKSCLEQLNPYRIYPCRFSAIYGWDLFPEVMNEIGLKFLPGMMGDQWVISYSGEGNRDFQFDFLRPSCFGKTYFASWMAPGAIGCTLSHLSILQDAYDAGYQTIWVMEDDISLKGNPYLLKDLIDKLDVLVGADGWDIFYTDLDTPSRFNYPNKTNDFESDLRGSLWFIWRPDMESTDYSSYAKRTIVSHDFLKIGSRMGTYSMVLRRSGIKKILDYEKSHRIFIPYDHELALVPNLRLYTLRYPLVTFSDVVPSDTRTQYFQRS